VNEAWALLAAVALAGLALVVCAGRPVQIQGQDQIQHAGK